VPWEFQSAGAQGRGMGMDVEISVLGTSCWSTGAAGWVIGVYPTGGTGRSSRLRRREQSVEEEEWVGAC
jgi:hypothetical protein